MPTTDLLPVVAVAKLLNRDVRTVHRMIRRGELDAIKAHDGIRAPYLVTRESAEAASRRAAA